MIDLALIRKFSPQAKTGIAQGLVDNWSMLTAAGITTPLRVDHFMTQIATETGGFSIFEENMNYTAERLCQVWPSRFPNLAAAQPYAHNPEKLANHVYGGRMGNVDPGDGWKYHGRGFMQTTGRSNYRSVGFERNPDALLSPPMALMAAVAEWKAIGGNALSDQDDLLRIRKAINGGLIGIEDARIWLERARRVFTAAVLADLPPPEIPAPVPVPKPVPASRPAPVPMPPSGTIGTGAAAGGLAALIAAAFDPANAGAWIVGLIILGVAGGLLWHFLQPRAKK